MIGVLLHQLRRLVMTSSRCRTKKLIKMAVLATFTLIGTLALTADPSHALIFDPARAAFTNDLGAAGFTGPSGIELFFGFLEFLMLAIPVATGLLGLSQMNRGPEAWMPWFSIMGGSLVFIAFVTVIVQRVYS